MQKTPSIMFNSSLAQITFFEYLKIILILFSKQFKLFLNRKKSDKLGGRL